MEIAAVALVLSAILVDISWSGPYGPVFQDTTPTEVSSNQAVVPRLSSAEYYRTWEGFSQEGLISTGGSLVGTPNYLYSSTLLRASSILYVRGDETLKCFIRQKGDLLGFL